MWLPLFLIFVHTISVSGDCAIYTDSDGPPIAAPEDRLEPRIYSDEWSDPAACPEFVGVPSCCSDWSNHASYENFQKIGTAFGHQGAGCDVCAANIKRFFCYYACSPNQTDFMKWERFDEMEVWNDTSGELVTMNVSRVSVNYNADQACALFESCSKISFLTQISAGGSALGFFTFMFDRGIVESYTKVDLQIVNQGGLEFTTKPHFCNETFPDKADEFGYEILESCPCNFCQDSCEPLTYVEYGNIMDGFSSGNVILAYFFAILLTIGFAFFKAFKKQKNEIASENLQRNLVDN